ncbi:MAG: hypothetical protein K8T25_11710 [Planctomycetia bacterium]|nr:hypothetical protein [Planctomycetia bacterium]
MNTIPPPANRQHAAATNSGRSAHGRFTLALLPRRPTRLEQVESRLPKLLGVESLAIVVVVICLASGGNVLGLASAAIVLQLGLALWAVLSFVGQVRRQSRRSVLQIGLFALALLAGLPYALGCFMVWPHVNDSLWMVAIFSVSMSFAPLVILCAAGGKIRLARVPLLLLHGCNATWSVMGWWYCVKLVVQNIGFHT